MLICSIVAFFRKAKFIIDWHNYGYTILKVNKRSGFICRLALIFERVFGKSSHLNFCVSKAMQGDWKKNFGITAICLPDQPMKGWFQFLKGNEVDKLFTKYNETLGSLIVDTPGKKPITMISSTSWTPDEDFDMLWKCFILTEASIKTDPSIDKSKIKNVWFLITGRGPMRDEFMKKVEHANWTIFNVRSIWWESDDYPKWLNWIDMGVSLHYSSSGIDLPMKVVDMFSACLPAAAVFYPTIVELVKEGENGFLFKNEEELCGILRDVILEMSLKGGVRSWDSLGGIWKSL